MTIQCTKSYQPCSFFEIICNKFCPQPTCLQTFLSTAILHISAIDSNNLHTNLYQCYSNYNTHGFYLHQATMEDSCLPTTLHSTTTSYNVYHSPILETFLEKSYWTLLLAMSGFELFTAQWLYYLSSVPTSTRNFGLLPCSLSFTTTNMAWDVEYTLRIISFWSWHHSTHHQTITTSSIIIQDYYHRIMLSLGLIASILVKDYGRQTFSSSFVIATAHKSLARHTFTHWFLPFHCHISYSLYRYQFDLIWGITLGTYSR